MTNTALQPASKQTSRRRRDWVPIGLALCVWLCTLPFVFLLIVPWLGVRAAIVMALALLPVIAVACRKLCAGKPVTGQP